METSSEDQLRSRRAEQRLIAGREDGEDGRDEQEVASTFPGDRLSVRRERMGVRDTFQLSDLDRG